MTAPVLSLLPVLTLAMTLAAASGFAQDTATTTKADGKLDLKLMLDWERVSSPRLSPDGKQVVFTRRWVDKVEDRNQSQLWIMNSDGSRQRFLTEESSATW